MAHYNLIVFTDTKPERKDLDTILAPYRWNTDALDPIKLQWDSFTLNSDHSRFNDAWLTTQESNLFQNSDIFQKKDLDLVSMRRNAELIARNDWLAVHEVVEDWEGFRSYYDFFKDKVYPTIHNMVKYAKHAYSEQPQVKRIERAAKYAPNKFIPLRNRLHKFAVPLEDYIAEEVAWEGVPYAYILYNEVTTMGEETNWDEWLYAQNDPRRLEWAKHFHDVLEDLPEDIWMTSLDCHI